VKIYVAVMEVRAVKVYVAIIMEALRRKERGDETQFFYHQNWWKIS
jgi:hypothetical protein